MQQVFIAKPNRQVRAGFSAAISVPTDSQGNFKSYIHLVNDLFRCDKSFGFAVGQSDVSLTS